MKKFLVIFLCCAFAFCLSVEAKNLEEQEKGLLKQEKKLSKEMFDLRVKLLQEDIALQKLHKKIMELHKELALQLDSNKKMRALAGKLRKVKNALAEVQAKIGDD